MEFCPNFISVDDDPAQWARDREAEGYPIISVADHISSPQPHPHVWVTATTFAMATERIRVMIAFANNLVRSPVEFAQAALALQRVSGGRCEAGLGAGWAGGGSVPSGVGAMQIASMMHSSGLLPLGRKRNQMASGPKALLGIWLGKRLK